MILTAKGRQESKIEGYRRGADAYLPKPFNTEELLVRLKQLLETRRKIQQRYQSAGFGNASPGENSSDAGGASGGAEAETTLGISEMDAAWLANLENIVREKMASETFSLDDLPALGTCE